MVLLICYSIVLPDNPTPYSRVLLISQITLIYHKLEKLKKTLKYQPNVFNLLLMRRWYLLMNFVIRLCHVVIEIIHFAKMNVVSLTIN